MKRTTLTFLLIILLLPAYAQWEWHNPIKAPFPVVQNQAFYSETGIGYKRLPDRAKGKVTDAVWNQSRHSSGLAIYFRSDAKNIKVRYTVSGPRSMAHMPTTGVSGLDLYRIDAEGQWQRLWGSYSFADTITYTFKNNVENKRYGRGYEFRLYLPLYNGVKWLEVGVPAGASFEFMPVEPEMPMVVYGTSIAQGACASRPAMAWTNILQRRLDYPLVNLGFSGNGLLAPEVIEFINEIDGRLYILDCLPNLTERSAKEIENLAFDAVRQIRDKHDAPVLLVEHIGYSNMSSDTVLMAGVEKANKALRRAYTRLIENGVANLHYLPSEEIGFTQDCWVDYIHPSDMGMQRQADAVEKKAREILHLPIGKCSTTVPVTQRRDVNAYEWRKRHHDILRHIDSIPPRRVIMGNSITHYWGGEPGHKKKNGAKAWDRYMAPKGYINMGYGWDRIENVLWRVYHGELDGFEAEQIVLMIGTNNCGFNTAEEIAEGLDLLTDAVAIRQPKATIKVIGILPRRGKEQWVKEVNKALQETATRKGIEFADPGTALLLPAGKINERLFNDGLHPNNDGYTIIAPEISR